MLVDFLHVLGSIEGRLVSAPGLFCCYYGFVDPSWNVLHLGVFGLRWCMFVDKGRQGRVILLVQSIGFIGWIVNYLFIWGFTSLSTLCRPYHNG